MVTLSSKFTLTFDPEFDAGLNIGLNRDTPAAQAYVGVSRRF